MTTETLPDAVCFRPRCEFYHDWIRRKPDSSWPARLDL